MEIISLVVNMMQCLCGHCCSNESIPRRCSYLRRPHMVFQRLEEKLRLLSAREADLRGKLHAEKVLRGKDPTAEVKLWLENVEKTRRSIESLENDVKEDRRCLCGCFPDYHQRVKLRIRISSKMDEVDKLLDQCNFSESFLVDMMPRRGKTLPESRLVGETANRILQRTWEALIDNDIRTIGIYGMGGVGKTTIMIEINNRLVRENSPFETVIWVTASKDSNLPKLQNDIAKETGLSFHDEDDEISRASQLFEALRRRGRFLLIIDDLWEAFSLQAVGIPDPLFHGCTLVITTRSLSVCRGMETIQDIKVDMLSEEEAWGLFKQKIGEDFITSPGIKHIAKIVMKECCGLPLALITVGRALRKENSLRQWQTALTELRNSAANIEGMENQVFARLKFSYDRLKDDMMRSCFMYCALYPEDHHIETEELIKYWIWEGLLGDFGSLSAKVHRGKIILNELTSACMLESVHQDGASDEYVKMHDLIWDMLVEIARVKPVFMIAAGKCLRTPPLQNEWLPDLERVSLMRNDLSSLICEPQCPQLHTLLLQYNSIQKGISPAFFEHMQCLKVLDLSYTGIERLPESVSNLENLHVLLLCSCWNLSYMPSLARLKELRVLDLSYTSIEHMPEGMNKLASLQHLNLSYTRASEAPIFLLPNYKFLENLYIIGVWQFTLGQIFIDVLTSCSNLAVLEVNFSSMQDFDRYISSGHWNVVDTFKFFVGYPPSSIHMGNNSVGFFGVQIYERLSPAWLPGRILELDINGCPGITHLPVFLTAASSQLQRFKMKYCDDVEWIFTAEWSTFPNIEWLNIEGLGKLSRICKGVVASDTLARLKVLHVRECSDLRTLLPFELVQHLNNLEEIEIENCEKLTEIIAKGEEDDLVSEVNNAETVLNRLQKLKLCSLPYLKSICRGTMICDSLSTLEISRCQELKVIPFFIDIRQQLVCSLKQIKGSRRWWNAVRRNHIHATNILQSIFKAEPEPGSSDQDSDYDIEDDNSIRSEGSANSSLGPR